MVGLTNCFLVVFLLSRYNPLAKTDSKRSTYSGADDLRLENGITFEYMLMCTANRIYANVK